MNVKDIMTQGVLTCHPDDDLATAAKLMWDGDCGILPVMEGGKLRGLITDRDICMGVATQGCPAKQITGRQVMNSNPVSCLPDSDLNSALDSMRKHRVRRLPVIGRDGELEGILSINDIILEAKASRSKTGGPTYQEVITCLQEISRHRELPAIA